MLPLFVLMSVIALGLSEIAFASSSYGNGCPSGSDRNTEATKECNSELIYHCLPDIECSQRKVCSQPIRQIIFQFPELEQTGVIKKSITFNSSNTELFQDIDVMLCYFNKNETKRKGLEMLTMIAEKLAIDIASNVQKGPCEGTEYTLATRNNTGCYIDTACFKQVETIVTELVVVNDKSLEYLNVTVPYNAWMSLLLCEIDRKHIQDYNISITRNGQTGENQAPNVAAVVVPIIVLVILLIIGFCILWKLKLKQIWKRGKRKQPNSIDLNNTLNNEPLL